MVITGRWMARRLTPADLVATQRAAFLAAYSDEVEVRDRVLVGAPGGEFVIMPAAELRRGYVAVKMLSAFPGNPARGLPANQAVVVLMDRDSGSVQALLDGTWITAARTGAAAALAMDIAGPREARTLAVLGAGPVADWAIRCCLTVRGLTDVRIWSRSPRNAETLARRLRRHAASPVHIRVVPDPVTAVTRADAVVTATSADRPLFPASALAPHAHISSMGGREPGWELDPDLFDQAHLIVDSTASWSEASDIALARERAGRDPVRLGALCAGMSEWPLADPGRPTVFRSVGVAFQDLFLALAALERCDGRTR